MKNVLIAMDGSKQSVFAFNRKYIYIFLFKTTVETVNLMYNYYVKKMVD